jgi:predicted nucleotidyltransferase
VIATWARMTTNYAENMPSTLPAEVLVMVERLLQAFHPRQIILFGSHARGEATPDSDVDLLVVVDRVDHPRQAMAAALRLFPDLFTPKDIIFTDPIRLKERCQIPYSLESIALREGRILYAA